MVAIGTDLATVLRETVYLPSDVIYGALSWREVIEAASSHADGLLGLVEGYIVEEYETVALAVSAALGDDGTRHHTACGQSLDDLSRDAGATPARRPGRWIRYEYPDRSAIIDCVGAWDLALDPSPGSECWCWMGIGEHSTSCPAARAAEEAVR